MHVLGTVNRKTVDYSTISTARYSTTLMLLASYVPSCTSTGGCQVPNVHYSTYDEMQCQEGKYFRWQNSLHHARLDKTLA